MTNHPGWNPEWGLSIGMMVLWVLFIAAIVFIVIHLVRGSGSTSPKGDPLDIAKARYAKGEITKQEFDQIKKDLSAK